MCPLMPLPRPPHRRTIFIYILFRNHCQLLFVMKCAESTLLSFLHLGQAGLDVKETLPCFIDTRATPENLFPHLQLTRLSKILIIVSHFFQ